MSCQPHRVTSGQSDSVMKANAQFKTSAMYVYIFQVSPQNRSLHKQKNSTCIHRYQTQIFEELFPSILHMTFLEDRSQNVSGNKQ